MMLKYSSLGKDGDLVYDPKKYKFRCKYSELPRKAIAKLRSPNERAKLIPLHTFSFTVINKTSVNKK